MSVIVIGGNAYSGNSVVVTNGKVIIDGKDVTPDAKEINISVQGDVAELKVDACNKVSVTGNVGSFSGRTGDVEISGDVSGDVQTTTGEVSCGAVSGSVSTSTGDVDCVSVGGSVSTKTGDIKYKRA